MALYSVWDWDRNAYRVYATKKPVSVGDDPSPPRPRGISALGADPDLHVKPLPSGAKLVGYSHMARGEIRRAPAGILSGAASESGSSNGALMFVAGAAVALGVSWWWRKRRRRW